MHRMGMLYVLQTQRAQQTIPHRDVALKVGD
jgi:hypothetical protein